MRIRSPRDWHSGYLGRLEPRRPLASFPIERGLPACEDVRCILGDVDIDAEMEPSVTSDSEGLHPIANTGPNSQADIVFVHGLGGASHSTWRYGKEGSPNHFFWPIALGADLPSYAI